MNYPSDLEAKRDILEAGRRMHAKGFVAANDGNLSCRVGEDAVWVTPSGVSKGYMTEEMLLLVDLRGNVLAGSGVPSSEAKMHLGVLAANAALVSCVHAHPPYATMLAIAGIPIERALLAETVLLGVVPVAPYAELGTDEVPASVVPLCRDYNAALLANHGAVSWGESVMQAYFRMEMLEACARLEYMSRILGKANLLTHGQVQAIMAQQRPGFCRGMPLCAEDEEQAKND